MKKFTKYLIGFLALPAVWAFSKVFYAEVAHIGYISSKLHFFSWGIIAYMLMHILFYKPVYMYTFGHEVIHVLATWLCFGQVYSFEVSKGGAGSVKTSKTNFFIELSPYFVPVYTILLICFLPFAESSLKEYGLFSWYIFLLGFTWGMHLIMTAESLKIKQPDITRSGYLFSFAVIYIANLLVLFSLLGIFASDISFKRYFMDSLISSRDLYWDIIKEFIN